MISKSSPTSSAPTRIVRAGTPRATWQHSRDTSTVWAMAIASSSDPAFVAPGAIPWLLLQVVGAQDGPTGGHKLTATTFIQRLNTSGGVAPSTGCAVSTDVGKKALVPYTADYFFFVSGLLTPSCYSGDGGRSGWVLTWNGNSASICSRVWALGNSVKRWRR